MVDVTGMCVVGFPVAVLPLWQLEQLVAVENVAWSTLADAQLVVDL